MGADPCASGRTAPAPASASASSTAAAAAACTATRADDAKASAQTHATAAASPSFWARFRRAPQPMLPQPQPLASAPLASPATAARITSATLPAAAFINTTQSAGVARNASPASPVAAASDAPAAAAPPQPLHTTEWKDVSMAKFCGLTVFFSTMENALFYPFYVLKTREQADMRALRTAAGPNAPRVSPWQTSVMHLRTILREQGVSRGLYRGFWASNLTAFPAYGVYMGVYSWAKEELGYTVSAQQEAQRGFKMESLYAPFIAGVVADAASVALYVPGDVVVQRLQLKDSPYSSFTDACVQIYRTDGASGFFRGFGATFLTSGLASAVWWVVYENVKTNLYRQEDEKARREATQAVLAGAAVPASAPAAAAVPQGMYAQLTSVNRVPQIVSGFIAGTLTSVLVNPLDVVKTRLQVQDTAFTPAAPAAAAAAGSTGAAAAAGSAAASSSSSPHAPTVRYRHMAHGLYRIWVDEGFAGYWRGIMPKLLSRGPLSAMSSLLYEVVMHLSKTEKEPKVQLAKFD